MASRGNIDKFIEQYILTLNATDSAIIAGYSERSAYSTGHRLLKNAEVQKKLQKERAMARKKFEINQEKVLNELARIGFGLTTDLISIDEEGNVTFKNIDDLDEDQKAMISEFTSIRSVNGDIVTTTTKVRVYDKLKALEMLSRHLGLFEKDNKQKIQINVNIPDEAED